MITITLALTLFPATIVHSFYELKGEWQLYFSPDPLMSNDQAIAICDAIGGSMPYDAHLPDLMIRHRIDSAWLDAIWYPSGDYHWRKSLKIMSSEMSLAPTNGGNMTGLIWKQDTGKAHSVPRSAKHKLICHIDLTQRVAANMLYHNIDTLYQNDLDVLLVKAMARAASDGWKR